ncbi:MAG: hypothetical protein E6F99_25255 [Actinobacteria bacterium]|nr:MAG: hypothetical protein E6F99_25255 [Actinomycetota bacterium]
MRYTVEPWSPSFGSPNQLDGSTPQTQSTAELKLDVELPVDSWRPLPARTDLAPPPVVLLVDGVRRIDAYLWIEDDDGASYPAVAASYAAGVVRCDLRRRVADVLHHRVRRGLFTAAPGATAIGEYEPQHAKGSRHEDVVKAVQPAMLALELVVSEEVRKSTVDDDDLLVTDGPLRGRHRLARTVGYIKTLETDYLCQPQAKVVTGCRPGERSPVFLTGPQWPHYSWYVRLPGRGGHPWAGMVRVQGSPDLTPQQAAALADRSTVTLPRFASTGYKDPRAPQNLVPVAGLERKLRNLLGDPRLLHRTLTKASVG